MTNDDGITQVDLNISMDYRVHNGKFVHPLEFRDAWYDQYLPDPQKVLINVIIHNYVDKVDFKVENVDLTVSGVSMTTCGRLFHKEFV